MNTRGRQAGGDLLRGLLRGFFRLLYRELAWTYDSVAWFVSLGRWYTWIEAVGPYLKGPRLLELGHGTGHLLARLARMRLGTVVGLDESQQMARRARWRAQREGLATPKLVRGSALSLPFGSGSMDCVVATFPTEFIFAPQTSAEIHRVLKTDGRLVILPAAWIVGHAAHERAAAWLFAVTRQTPPRPQEWISRRFELPLASAGFKVAVERLDMGPSFVYVVIASKAP